MADGYFVSVERLVPGKRRLLVEMPDEVMRRHVRRPASPPMMPLAEKEKEVRHLPKPARDFVLSTHAMLERSDRLLRQLCEMYVAKGYAAFECDEDDPVKFMGTGVGDGSSVGLTKREMEVIRLFKEDFN